MRVGSLGDRHFVRHAAAMASCPSRISSRAWKRPTSSVVKNSIVFALGLLAVLAGRPVASATIKVHRNADKDFHAITVEGELRLGDEKTFIE
jgi:hypothetical protein